MRLVSELLHALAVVLAAAGVGVFVLLVIGLLVTSVRVGVLGRVLVLPFRGMDERRGELTALFATRLIEIEQEWAAAARELTDLRTQFQETTSQTGSKLDNTSATKPEVTPPEPKAERHPLADGAPVAHTPVPGESRDVASGPRTTGDDFLDDILLLDEDSSLAGADLGTLSIAGVSFSPHHVLAFLRRLPSVFARRVLSGSLLTTGDGAVLTVTYAERSLRRRPQVTRCVAEIGADAWLSTVDGIAFEIAKARIERLRERRGRKARPSDRAANEPSSSVSSAESGADSTRNTTTASASGSGSYTADRALVEAETWKAAKAFLAAYASHLRHYVSGRASDRDEALWRYDQALQLQPGYTRAAYNRATLAYNRYLPFANKQAITDFECATASHDQRVRALAWAGLAMAYCQAIHRFNADPDALAPEAVDASQRALELEPDLEEPRFARAWAYQTQGEWNQALNDYDEVLATPIEETAPGRRIKSFALNNAGWIWLKPLHRRKKAIIEAEQYFWRAVDYYPNKVAYANLAEVARSHRRYNDALAFFERALKLDDCYVNAWNERAQLEVEIAATALSSGDARRCKHFVAEAAAHYARARRIAEDEDYAKQLGRAFQKTVKKHTSVLGPRAETLAAKET
jgi:tetratricopeptide (TPR) repeat protein